MCTGISNEKPQVNNFDPKMKEKTGYKTNTGILG